MKKFKILMGSFAATVMLLAVVPVAAHAEWKQNNTGWWYSQGNSYATSWAKIDGQWYYFNSNGYMMTGWVNDGGTWYYLNGDGSMAHDTTIDGYYLNSNGSMKGSMNKDDNNMAGMNMN